jgi:hypothetical protein
MSVKKFKFVSPGVFINEIDNSFLPRRPDVIGPTVIGRATSGLAMQPVKVDAYSDFVSMFGDTVPGQAGGDVYRDGQDTQAPIYGTYAAKGFLNAGVAPLTYVRALGHQHPSAESATAPFLNNSEAGWRTEGMINGTDTATDGGGAFGLFIMPSASLESTGSITGTSTANTASLAAVWYLESGLMMLSGSSIGSGSAASRINYKGVGTVIESDSNGLFKAIWRSGDTGEERAYDFSLDDNSQNFIRRVFNTNPQLTVSGNFYPTSAETSYWLGESYEQEIRDRTNNNVASTLFGFILPLQLSGSSNVSPANRLGSNAQAREAVAGWFISQDTGVASEFNPASKTTKLFRFIGRGHGAWLSENVKISIANIRQSNNSTTDYGSFSVVVRSISDTDSAQQVLERFDNCNLDPTSPNYIGRKIGDQYNTWDEGERRLKTYGEYPNQSKYIYVDIAADVAAGASGMETLLPFGYYGAPKYSDVNEVLIQQLNNNDPVADASYTYYDSRFALARTGSTEEEVGASLRHWLSASESDNDAIALKLTYPAVRLRNSASEGGISDPRNAFFGMAPTRTSGSTRYDRSVANVHSMLSNQFENKADPTDTSITGIDGFSYIFTLDNVVDVNNGVGNPVMFYRSGSRTDETSFTALAGKTYKDLLDAGYNNFTAPLWGGFDGFNVKLADPLYNEGMDSGTERSSAAYYTVKRAIDSVADPEVVETNLITMPGLTNTSLTQHMINICEERADALAVIDLPDVYLPTHEGQYNTLPDKADRINTTPQQSATALRDRRIDSSYGCTFYPWVQTRDERTGAAVWLPPSAAMLGVLASSERKAQLWFAPAGFNRGGLTDGAAGIPVSSVTEKLTSKQRDLLYEANINPIASFPSTGIVVFGQKTLQESQSALDRINVRRLVIYLKKEISRISTKILFEQNVHFSSRMYKLHGTVSPVSLSRSLPMLRVTSVSLTTS